jgi:hypothetical protein
MKLTSGRTRWSTYPAEIRYSPFGLQSRPFTGPLCPPTAPTSAQASFPFCDLQRHLLQPPDQPQANASFPPLAHAPPTNPPNLCPPMSPNRCRLIQIEADRSREEVRMVEGDQSISEESVDVESRVGVGSGVVVGRQERDVIPASCPMRRASNVIENCCGL